MRKKKRQFNRYIVFIVILISTFAAIIYKLYFLQIVKGQEYSERVNKNYFRSIQVSAPRGNIIDAKGKILATNEQNYELIYMSTEDGDKKIIGTLKIILPILDKYNEKQKDDLELKVNPYRFEFNVNETDAAKADKIKKNLEIRFKRDRGLQQDIEKKLYPGKSEKELSDSENKRIDNELLKLTPEQTFRALVAKYKINKKMSVVDQRRYMLVLDAIFISRYSSGYKPIIISENIKQQTAYIFWQTLNNLPGIDVTLQPMRVYPNGELASNILGYISKINSSDKDIYEEQGYDLDTDYVGSAGIEKAFEDKLKGSKGEKIVKINKDGKIIEELGKMDSYPGQNIQLTIDKDIQYAAEKSLDDTMKQLQNAGLHSDGVNTANATCGAAVAIDVKTGKILALASRPGFDPNVFSNPEKMTPDIYKQYFNPDLTSMGEEYIKKMELDISLDTLLPQDTRIKDKVVRQDMYDVFPKPLYNYATQTLMPSGSTFKPITAIAGLEEGVIDSSTTILDDGIFNKYVKDFKGSCWIYNEGGGSHGLIDVKTALEVSCNYFFFEVGHRLFQKGGLDLLAKYAWKLGLGVNPKSKAKMTTGIEIPENFGTVYYSDYGKRALSTLYYSTLVTYLNKGTDTRGNKFKPIDLTININDSKEASQIKGQIKTLITAQMKGTKISDFDSKLKDLFSKLINAVPEYKNKGFSRKDINSFVSAADYSVYDADGEIDSEANVYGAAIGQGLDKFTPLQLANALATIVNGGTRYKVHLVDKYLDSDNKVIEEIKPEIMDKVSLKPETLKTVKDGMLRVTSGEDGTAAGVFDGLPITTAGKTGSATFSEQQNSYGRTSYGVYLGFAPYDKPEIAVCVVIFNGGHGGYVAPVARAIYEAYFKDTILQRDPGYVFKYNT